MIPADITQAAADYDLYRRALARCVTSEPHIDADDAPPCSGCLLATAKRLAIPPAHVSPAAVAPFSLDRRRAEGATGVVGPRALPASPGLAAPPSTKNRPPARNEGPAEGATAIAQKQV